MQFLNHSCVDDQIAHLRANSYNLLILLTGS